MKRQTVCEKCGSILEYDDKSVWLGNRDWEDICCPVCNSVVDSIFTDQIPTVRVIQNGETK
jgi:hypothetical protein